MKRPRRRHHRSPVAVALYVNAALLAAILVALVARNRDTHALAFDDVAWGQVQQPIAGGGGLFVMPAQFSTNVWGCYVMDIDTQTLVAYTYTNGDRTLRLTAARNFRFDRQLAHFNTEPPPLEVKGLVEKEKADDRVRMKENLEPVQPEAKRPD
jgi:hypothetical protein